MSLIVLKRRRIHDMCALWRGGGAVNMLYFSGLGFDLLHFLLGPGIGCDFSKNTIFRKAVVLSGEIVQDTLAHEA